MNKREAKCLANRMVARLVSEALGDGWPYESTIHGLAWRPVPLVNRGDGELTEDGDRVELSLHEILAELQRRGGK